MALFASLSIIANYYLPLSGALCVFEISMNSEKFVSLLKSELDNSFELYASKDSYIGSKLDSLELSPENKGEVLALVKEAVTENLYVLLCALEGSSSLAGNQQIYTVSDENNSTVSGELDSEFYMQVIEASV